MVMVMMMMMMMMVMMMVMVMVMIFSFDQKNCSYSCFLCLSLKLFYLHVALFGIN